MSLLEMWELVLEEGLPARVERERLLAERLAEDDAGDTTGSSFDGSDTPDAPA